MGAPFPREGFPGQASRFIASAPEGAARVAREPNLSGVYVWTLAVLALIALAYAALRRWTRRARRSGDGAALRILERRPIAPRQELLLVEVESRIFLIGATRERFSTLGAFHRSEERGRSEAPPPATSYDEVAEELRDVRRAVREWSET
ncbi:MAG: flagellar biosynthetic protein FliO [Planctomycetes bacterium]|nr:flagellar biosynthetic protein FliO [Planctomycetota bacterium]